MASLATSPAEQVVHKPSFAKVAASAYMPQLPKEDSTHINASSQIQSPPEPQIASSTTFNEATSKASKEGPGERRRTILARPEDLDARNGQWNEKQDQNPPISGSLHRADSGLPNGLQRRVHVDDSSTQLSLSDDSAKPPSIDGKSVTSGTTFALDEKESLRPDDSASLRAAEEDGTSPPGSVAAGSRLGSENGAARAFSDQLREIAIMGAVPLRGAPPGRMQPALPQTVVPPYLVPQPMNTVHSIPPQLATTIPAETVDSGPAPDEKLLEALESQRDRVWVLKLEQDLIDFVKDPKESQLSLPNCNAFYRMLAHKLADYYLLGHMVDETMTAVRITKTDICRIPPPLSGFSTATAAVSTPPVEVPTRKIMRRGDENRMASGTNTTANSENPSTAASEVGGGSDGGADKGKTTHELRMARYQEARQRIFGQQTDDSNADDTSKTEENDNSRSSSASGKKTKKKTRNYDDEDFESRAQFCAIPPNVYSPNGFPSDQSQMMYSQFAPGQMNPQQYSMMSPPIQQQMPYGNGYHMSHEMQQHYNWQNQMYHQAGPPMNYGMPQHTGYDLSADFQRGMQSFQSAPNLTPQMQKGTPAMMPHNYQSHPQTQPQPQPQGMSPSWSQTSHQSGYQQNPNPYVQPNQSPAMSSQGMYPSNYAYGQLPAPMLSNGKQNKNQHPLPGSYQRNQFNPQSQAFVPGSRGPPFQMQGIHPQMTPPPMNSYPGQPFLPVSNQMGHPSPPHPQPNSFSSPHMTQGSPIASKGNNGVRQSIIPQQMQSNIAPVAMDRPTQMGQTPSQSSIAKWGTPSSLPPKPPPPASMQPQKFSLPGQNMTAAARLPPAPTVAIGRTH